MKQFTLTGRCLTENETKEVDEMTYNSEGWKETKIEVGKILETEVLEIKEDKISTFVKNWDTFDKTGSADPNAPAILVVTSVGANVLISLPKGKDYHPKSKLGKWIKTYGKAPYLGQKVRAMVDSSGFYNIVLA
jgi:hypothetical protein